MRHTIARVEYWGKHLGSQSKTFVQTDMSGARQDFCSNTMDGKQDFFENVHYGYGREARLFSNAVVQSKIYCEARFLLNYFGCEARLLFKNFGWSKTFVQNFWVRSKTFVQKFWVRS